MTTDGDQTPAPLTGRGYWDSVWRRRRTVTMPRESHYPDRRFMELFRSLDVELHGMRVLEVGAGSSRWLPFFATVHRARVWGIDYSTIGCETARRALASAPAGGTILERDLFDPNEDLVERFDLVYSLGLVEHFRDTAAVVRAIARFARPGALVLTIVPNMCGSIGVLQRLADRDVYEQHVRLTPAELRRAHEVAGLTIERSAWFGTYDPAVVNEGRSPWLTTRALSAFRLATRIVVWTIVRALRITPETSVLSPYVVCVARRARQRT